MKFLDYLPKTLILISAIVSFLIGLIFFYKPNWIILANQFVRSQIFPESQVIHERLKKGSFFVLVSLLLTYWGYTRFQYTYTSLAEHLISTDRLLYQSLQFLYAKRYGDAKILCERALMRDPNNATALYQLGAARLLLKDIVGANESWTKAAKLDPNSLSGKHLRNLVSRLSGEEFANKTSTINTPRLPSQGVRGSP